jgi:hypothetical protein
MDRIGDHSNSEYKITLKPKFNWFLTDEFKELRNEFEPTDNKEFLTKRKSAVIKIPPVLGEELSQPQEEKEVEKSSYEYTTTKETDNNNDSHKGENGDSKNSLEKDEKAANVNKAFKLSPKGDTHFTNGKTNEKRF